MEKCIIEGCNRDKYCKGMCKAHYDQIRKTGKITKKILPPPLKCKCDNCNRDAVSSGYCKKHYEQYKRNGKTFDISVHEQNEIIIKDNYAEIALYNRKCQKISKTIIDIEDIEKVKGHRCGITKGYAYIYINGKRIRLNRYLLNTPKNKVVDHINHDKLDNRRKNLRICTIQQNSMNRLPIGKSKVCGVYWDKNRSKWEVVIKVNDKSKFLGRYKSKLDAIEVRRQAELKYFGEYSYLNRNKTI